MRFHQDEFVFAMLPKRRRRRWRRMKTVNQRDERATRSQKKCRKKWIELFEFTSIGFHCIPFCTFLPNMCVDEKRTRKKTVELFQKSILSPLVLYSLFVLSFCFQFALQQNVFRSFCVSICRFHIHFLSVQSMHDTFSSVAQTIEYVCVCEWRRHR